ncbi:MAG TPA: SDR family oxidoreductase [Anaerolineae bacterium]|nr:SDR family oxidoreductase [Anaerolineae bacterium]
MNRLCGQVAIVTGAGRGVGRAVALELARRGADVVVVSRTEAEALLTKVKIQELGQRAVASRTDVSDPVAVERMVALTLAEFGHIDILINNAGVIAPIAPAEQCDPEAWSRNIDINLKGPFYVSNAVIPHMRRQGRGVIINVGSSAAHQIITGWSAYSAAKAGLYRFTQILAAEVEPYGIRVLSVRPGAADTSMQEEIRSAPEKLFGRENLERFRRKYEEGRLFPPDVPARMITWACTQEASDLTGVELDVRDPELRRRAGLD